MTHLRLQARDSMIRRARPNANAWDLGGRFSYLSAT
jgi:hypothetical protein